MTVAWDTVEDALQAWAASIVGAELGGDDKVVWRDRAKGVLYAPYLELRIENETPVGTPDVENVIVNVDGRDVIAPKVTGLVSFTVEARIRSRDQTSLRAARWYLEKLRASLYSPPILAPLHAAGVAFNRSHERIQTVPFEHEGRFESVAILEAFFTVKSEFFLPTTHTVDYVETAEISLNGEPPFETPSP